MSTTTWLVGAAIVFVVFWLLRGLIKHSGRRASRRGMASGEYRAVSILAPPDACEAADELHGVRFLCDDAPPIPLITCDRASCRCRYEHHADRRASERRIYLGRPYDITSTYTGPDRRRSANRRQPATT